MRSILVGVILGFTVLSVSDAAASSDALWRVFTGFWAGIDPEDGSLVHRSILCTRDGHCHVLGSDSYFTICASSEGRGRLEGEGTIQGRVLTVLDFMLTCADGESLSIRVTFTLGPRHGMAVEAPAPEDIPSITLHKLR